MTIGFIYNVGMGTSQLCIWDEDSQTLTLKDSDEKRASSFLNEGYGHPAPEDVCTESVENV